MKIASTIDQLRFKISLLLHGEVPTSVEHRVAWVFLAEQCLDMLASCHFSAEL